MARYKSNNNTRMMLLISFILVSVLGLVFKFQKHIMEFINSDKFLKFKKRAEENAQIAEQNEVSIDDAALASSWEGIRHFVPSEFDSRGKEGTGLNMDIDYVAYLDQVREVAGFPFHVGSGFRTPEHNADIKHNGKQYSAKNSPHMHGIASDISFDTLEEALIALESYLAVRKALRPEWKLGLGFYGSLRHGDAWFIHSDNRKHTTERDVLWFSDRYNVGQYRNVPSDVKAQVQRIFDTYKT